MIYGIKEISIKEANQKADNLAKKNKFTLDHAFRLGSPVFLRINKEHGCAGTLIDMGSETMTKEELIYECYLAGVIYSQKKYTVGGNYCSYLYTKTKNIMTDRWRRAKRIKSDMDKKPFKKDLPKVKKTRMPVKTDQLELEV